MIEADSDSARQGIPPALFELVGWSCLILGCFTVLFSATGLFAIPSVKELQRLLAQPPFDSDASLRGLETIIRYAVPLSLAQLLAAAIWSYASWMFLKRKSWARQALLTLNWLSLVCFIWVFGRFFQAIQNLLRVIQIEEFMAEGTAVNIPTVLWSVWAVSFILSVLPIIGTGWYLHSRKVRSYCSF